MDVTILNKRGLKSKLPNLRAGQIYFATDTKEIFIGSSSGNVKLLNEDDYSEISTSITNLDASLSAGLLTKASTSHNHGWLNSFGNIGDENIFVSGRRLVTFVNGNFDNNYLPTMTSEGNQGIPLNQSNTSNILSEARVYVGTRPVAINTHNNIAANTFTASTVSNTVIGTQYEINVYAGTTTSQTGASGIPIIGQLQLTRGTSASSTTTSYMGTSNTAYKTYHIPIWNPATSAFQVLTLDFYVQSVSLFFRWNSTPSLSLSFVIRWY